MFVIIKKKKLFIILICFVILLLVSEISYFILLSKNCNTRQTAENPSKYLILIEIDEKKLYLFEDAKLIKKYPIASGKPGWPSPIGQWKITEKDRWGEEFGGRWMGLDVIWGKYGIHGTTKEGSIGRAASHGCIRMYNKDIRELYAIVPVGTVVIIKNGPFGPFGSGFRSIKPGDRGADVLAVQQRLKELGYFDGQESGIFEDNLKHALYKFQAENKLKIKNTITREDYNAMGFWEFE